MAKSRKTQSIGDIIAEKMADSFAELANDNRFWINKRVKSKKDAPMVKVGRGLDIDALNAEFNDDEFFNVWMDVEDCTKGEQADMIEEVANTFYGTSYFLGTKYPYTSKDGTKVSLAILKSS